MKGKILMLAITLHFIGGMILILYTLIQVKLTGHSQIIEPNSVILYIELAYTSLLLIMGIFGVAYLIKKYGV
jgi:hypothetical protein